MTTARELPDHIASTDEWKLWPLKSDAHLQWGVRERQVTALCRSGKLAAWICPDTSVRIEPEKLTELYGPPGRVVGRERDRPPSEQARLRTAPIDTDDPVVGMFREVVLMLREARQEKADLLKLITDPMGAILAAFQQMLAESRGRVVELEKGWLDVMDLRSELADTQHERALQLTSAAAREKRRDETLSLIKPHLPKLFGAFAGGSDLASFVKECPPELISTVLDSQLLPKHLEDKLRKAATPTQTTSNGASNHGHS